MSFVHSALIVSVFLVIKSEIPPSPSLINGDVVWFCWK